MVASSVGKVAKTATDAVTSTGGGLALSAAGTAASSILGANAASKAAKQSAKATTEAADEATNAETNMYNETRSDLSPYNKAGQSALTSLQSLLNSGKLNKTFSFNASDLDQTPGYQFTLQQGNRAVNNQAAASGLNLSGAQLKGISDYTTGLADQTYNQQYQNALNTFQTNYAVNNDQYNRLISLAGLGESAAAQTGSYGTQTANSVGNTLYNAGSTAGSQLAAGTTASTNALTSGLGSVSNTGLLYSLLKDNA